MQQRVEDMLEEFTDITDFEFEEEEEGDED
jgi:hypothetical protein